MEDDDVKETHNPSNEYEDDDDMFEDITPSFMEDDSPATKSPVKKTSNVKESDFEDANDVFEEDDAEEEDLYEEEVDSDDSDFEEDEDEEDTSNQVNEEDEDDTRENRRIRQLVDMKKASDDQAAELAAKNAELEKQLKQLRKTKRTDEKEFAESRKESLDSQIKTLQKSMLQAKRDGDFDAEVELNLKLQEAIVDKKALDAYLSTEDFDFDEDDGEAESTPTKTKSSPISRDELLVRLPKKARKWAEDNKWFGVNNQLTLSVVQIGADLEKEGFDSSEDEYYEELNTRLHEQYPSRFSKKTKDEEDAPRKPKPQVGKSTKTTVKRRPKNAGKRRLPRLSEEEREMADRLGLSLKEYATEKAKLPEGYEQGLLVTMD